MDVFAQKTTLQIIKDSPIYFLEQKKNFCNEQTTSLRLNFC